jgi:hypothetical protein
MLPGYQLEVKEGETMSERTRCNFCTLQDIKRREEKDGAQVIIRGNQGMLQPVVVYPDNSEKKIGAWFMELTDYCCC